VRRDPDCPACGTRTIRGLREETSSCGEVLPPGRVPEITPAELVARVARGDALTLLDVRESREWELGHIPGARLAPLSRLGEEVSRLDRSVEVIAYCRSGVRSQTAGLQLRAAGFTRVLSLAGGILRYGAEFDPTLPRY
jgi:adenylyltransferase/sulfurtransferase